MKKTLLAIVTILILPAVFFFSGVRDAWAVTVSSSVSMPTDNFQVVGNANEIKFYTGNDNRWVGSLWLNGCTSSGSVSLLTDNFWVDGVGNEMRFSSSMQDSSNPKTPVGSISFSDCTVSGAVAFPTDNFSVTGVSNRLDWVSGSGISGSIALTETVPTTQPPAEPPPATPVIGACSSTHYNCSAGTSYWGTEYATSYEWWCGGTNGGADTLCSETKPAPGATVPAFASVKVKVAPGLTFTGSPTSITSGASSNLTWASTNADSCTVTVNGTSAGAVPVSYTNWNTGSLTANTTYAMTCTGQGGSVNKSVTITVVTNGLCSNPPAHYTCAAGTSGSNVNGTTAYTWTCAGSNGGTTASCSEAKQMADLTAGSVTPTSATAGSAAAFSAMVTNQGNAATGAGFTDLFQRATDASGSGATDIGTSANSALSAGNSSTASLSYTFPSAGTHYLRVCADKSSAGNAGTIAESNENNNCGAWTAVTVSNPTCANGASNYPTCTIDDDGVCLNGANNPPTCTQYTPTASLSASPSVIDAGQSTTLTWSSTNATSCTAAGGFSTSGTTSGNVVVSPSSTATYSITCSGAGGTSAPANATVTVLVPTVSISANPLRVRSGSPSTITWSASGVTACTVSGPNSPPYLASGSADASNNFTRNSPYTATITGQSTYTITCGTHGPDDVTDSVTVNTLPLFQEF